MSNNTKNKLTTRIIMDATGLSYSAAYKRKLKYDAKEVTRKEALCGKKEFNKRVAILKDGTTWTAPELADYKGCQLAHAYRKITEYNEEGLSEENLLKATTKRPVAIPQHHIPMPTSSKERLYNLDKIPQPSAWERENML
jgi:hypothetical protein